ncbi:hypothetical protein Vadar_023626 [Vaccinium darrowii]|uniref:Uncharacterized protein n=1 Tax=Vaccinium darrowii TaxID=229202 RepID=A0ACB7YFB5_9ERIC|nr:hypothetical protein Vadar_023626 [Vaccinium darrowii]
MAHINPTTVDDDLSTRFHSFHLTEEEQHEVALTHEDIKASEEECRTSLFGKIISQKQANFGGLKTTMELVRGNPKNFLVLEIGNGIYQFILPSETDVIRILNGKPWFFNNHFLNLQRWNPDLHPSQYCFNLTPDMGPNLGSPDSVHVDRVFFRWKPNTNYVVNKEDPTTLYFSHHRSSFTPLPPIFTYEVLKSSTNRFDPNKKIGDGGFCSVYLGNLPNGKIVVVKHLHKVKPHPSTAAISTKAFCNEILILSSINDPNMVKIHGYCPDLRALFIKEAEKGICASNRCGLDPARMGLFLCEGVRDGFDEREDGGVGQGVDKGVGEGGGISDGVLGGIWIRSCQERYSRRT